MTDIPQAEMSIELRELEKRIGEAARGPNQ